MGSVNATGSATGGIAVRSTATASGGGGGGGAAQGSETWIVFGGRITGGTKTASGEHRIATSSAFSRSRNPCKSAGSSVQPPVKFSTVTSLKPSRPPCKYN